MKLKHGMIAILVLDVICAFLYAINFFVGLSNKDDLERFSEAIAELMIEVDASGYEGGYV